MAEAVSPLEGRLMKPDRKPELGVVKGGRGEQEDLSTLERAVKKFPDYKFELDERRFIAGAYEVTDQQRLRVAAKILADTVPEFRHLASPNERKRIQEKKNDYLKERVETVIEGKRQRQNRGQLIDTDTAVDTVFYGMAEANHPTAQLMGQIADEFEGKLHAKQLGWLYSQLVVLTGWDELKGVYEQQLATPEQSQ